MQDGQTKSIDDKKTIFGSFFLGENEFAIPVSFVQEVVNAPNSYTAIPLAPKYIKGLFNLRGSVIPVIDLKEVLNLSDHGNSDHQKVAVMEIDGVSVGIIFDKTGEVFSDNENERSDFDQNKYSGVISGVFKKDSGKRLVQILDVVKIFNLQNVPKNQQKNRLDKDLNRKKRGARKQCISFVVGSAKCSLEISDIQEILKIEKVNVSALSGGHCIGTIDLRGSTVPVIDFASLLNYRVADRTDNATKGDRRILVIKLENERFGLLVESVDSIVSYFPDELLKFALIEQVRAEMFLGCITGHGDSDILLLDHQKILNNQEVAYITRGHSKLYQNHLDEKQKGASKTGARKSYITFRISDEFAIAINEVKEIIDYPKNLMHPPGLKKHIKGILNLRGDLVTIIDSRSLYSTAATEHTGMQSKVLVFNNNGLHFGLVVDSVESIITLMEKDKVKLPEMLYSASSSKTNTDISEAVEVIDSMGHKRNLLILSAEMVASRAMKSLVA